MKKKSSNPLRFCYTTFMKTKTYTVYHNYSKDAEFSGTREECEAWISKMDPKNLGWFCIQ
jgi:ABC-type cobalt transport system substrate-binding protein